MKNTIIALLLILSLLLSACNRSSQTESSAVSDPRADGAYWENHVLLDSKGNGQCKYLTDEVFLTYVFVDDAATSWTDTELQQYLADMRCDLERLQLEAKVYGASVNFTDQYFHVSVDMIVDVENEYNMVQAAMDKVGYSLVQDAQIAYKDKQNASSAPFVFLLNKPGKSYALYSSIDEFDAEEFILLYEDSGDALAHELMHLYGAIDFYNMTVLCDLATEHFPDSIMLEHTGTVDDVTAALIGWTNIISEKAILFLEATESLTLEDLCSTTLDSFFTGTKIERYSNGAWYEGQFVHGLRHGHGVYHYADGDVYEGAFVNGKPHGYGKITFVQGDLYEGEFQFGVFYGYGVYYYISGHRYEGEFENGLKHGEGVYYFANGDRYEGVFKDGFAYGQGTYYNADGSIGQGRWEGDTFIKER